MKRFLFFLCLGILPRTAAPEIRNPIIYYHAEAAADWPLRVSSLGINKLLIDIESVFRLGYFTSKKYVTANREDARYLLRIRILRYVPNSEVTVLLRISENTETGNENRMEEILFHRWRGAGHAGNENIIRRRYRKQPALDNVVDLINRGYRSLNGIDRDFKYNALLIAEEIMHIMRTLK